MSTFESESEAEFESELEEEAMSGYIRNLLGGLLGEGKEEAIPLHLEFEVTAHLPELQSHPMHDYQGQEQFFKPNNPGYGRFVRCAAPIFARIARLAAPIVGAAIRGSVGTVSGRVASSALGGQELEQQQQVFAQGDFEVTGGFNESMQAAHEIVNHEVTHHEALAEMMAQQAAFAKGRLKQWLVLQ